ncbi:MAG: SpoIIE family protein phosphatase [Leptospiraceae bacterium]|nr:SpoIIE family protein phosphatase [Leptospiraceae bacterium]
MKIGISKKINFLFFSGMLLSTISVGIPFYINYFDEVLENANIRLNNGVDATSNINPFSDIDTYDLKTPANNPVYIKNWNKIKFIQKEFKLKYVYLLRMTPENKFQFVYDSGDDPYVVQLQDKNGNYYFEYTDFTPEERKKIPPIQDEGGQGDDNYFELYPEAPLEMYLTFLFQKKISTGEYTDRWGTFISIFRPVFKEGKPIGIMGVDLEISYIKKLKRNAFILFGFILSLGIVIIFIFRKIIYHKIINPILVVSEGSNKISEGNLEFKIGIFQKDEIGELAKNFNKMSLNLKESFKKIKQYNEHLEDMVLTRTKQLQDSLVEVEKLKKQQDGDYFLTTLIANPLMQNKNTSPNAIVEFKLIQKKSFNFRNKEYRLGGDICISGNMSFKEGSYTMIMNGDAMGKSMQGAGGALVLGSLLNSIMERSSKIARLSLSPAEWLVDTFNEIQSVMESFQGTMFVSMILGLVNTETGHLLYLNADHPYPIIIRDEKAFFINTHPSCAKLGIPNNTIKRLFKTKLQDEDIFLIGSDGRDDIQIKDFENGGWRMNNDQNQILKISEEAKGNLDEIYNRLSLLGEITDDFSFIKLTFKSKK